MCASLQGARFYSPSTMTLHIHDTFLAPMLQSCSECPLVLPHADWPNIASPSFSEVPTNYWERREVGATLQHRPYRAAVETSRGRAGATCFCISRCGGPSAAAVSVLVGCVPEVVFDGVGPWHSLGIYLVRAWGGAVLGLLQHRLAACRFHIYSI